MNKTIISLGSVTYAIKARKLLTRAGIRSKIIKADAFTSVGGCTHGLEIDSNDFYAAIAVLRENGIGYSMHSK